jgi:hypothetical protein
MRKFISITILSIFLTHFIGFYVYFVVRQAQIRQEMREMIGSLPAGEFEIFELEVEEYEKIRVNEHEVRIDGKMYDHSTPKIEKGKIILYAKHDQAEDSLIGFISEVVNKATNDSQPVPSALMNFLSLHFVPVSTLEAPQPPESIEIIDGFQAHLLSPHYPVLSPPPRS